MRWVLGETLLAVAIFVLSSMLSLFDTSASATAMPTQTFQVTKATKKLKSLRFTNPALPTATV
jgi:hypothetical protein